MKCPYCGEELEMYESYDTFIDDDTLMVEEHWVCTNRKCDRTFGRDITYKAVKKGMLEE